MQVDQDFEDGEDVKFEKYDLTEEVNTYVNNMLEKAEGNDNKSIQQSLTELYEKDAVESSHFYGHIKNQTVDFNVSSKMRVNPESTIGFVKRMESLGYKVPEIGGVIKNVPVDVILNNWDFKSL